MRPQRDAWFCCLRSMWFVLLTLCLLICHQVWSTFVKLMHQSLYCLDGIFSGNFKQTLVSKGKTGLEPVIRPVVDRVQFLGSLVLFCLVCVLSS